MVLVHRIRPLRLHRAWAFQRARPGALTFPFHSSASRCHTEPAPVQGHMAHRGQWSSERCLHHQCNTRPGFSEGPIQRLAVWEGLVLFLIARLACQIKQHSSFDRLTWFFYVTFLNFWLVSGFLMQRVEAPSIVGSICTRPSICLSPRRRCYTSHNPLPKLPSPPLGFMKHFWHTAH